MTITSFTVDGVEVQPLIATFDIRETAGGVSTLTCDLLSSGSPVLRYGAFSEVVVIEDTTHTIFAGIITQALEKGFGGPKLDAFGNPQICTTITAEDYNRIGDRISATETVVAGTLLKAFLTTLVTNYLDGFGVSLDGAQVDGPALPDMSFDIAKLSEVLKALSDATGYLWRIDYDKKLRMWAEGDLTAPFNVAQTDVPLKYVGDMEVETILGDSFANRVIVIGAPIEEKNHVETFVGDGTTTTFLLDYTLTAHRGIVTVGGNELVTEAAIKAYAFLTTPANFVNGDTVTIDSTVYTFESVFSNTAYHIPIGATALESKQRLVLAINGTGTPGTDYGTGTAAHPTCDAIIPSTLGGGDNPLFVMVAHYSTAGVIGNGTPVSETSANAFWYHEGGGHVTAMKGGQDAGTYTRYTLVDESLNNVDESPAANWSYDPVTNSITRNLGAPDSGDSISITFDGNTPGPRATAEDAADIAAHGLYEHTERRSDVTTTDAAQAMADAILAQLLASGEQTVSYVTRDSAPTLRAGQKQTITVPARDVSGDFIFRDVRIYAETDPMYVNGWLTRQITAKKTQVLIGKWQQTYHDWLKVGSPGSNTSGSGTVQSVSGPAPPTTSVQFNRAGSFGGDEHFEYDEDSDTVMIGTGHTPGGSVNLLIGSGHTVN